MFCEYVGTEDVELLQGSTQCVGCMWKGEACVPAKPTGCQRCYDRGAFCEFLDLSAEEEEEGSVERVEMQKKVRLYKRVIRVKEISLNRLRAVVERLEDSLRSE
jgi:hypothetical protein